MDEIQLIDIRSIIPNKFKLSIYKVPENYEEIVDNIRQEGIIEPLILNKNNVVISGNLRLQIALELGIEKVKVVYMDVPESEMDLISISTNQNRIKRYSEIFKEMQFLESHYNIKQGSRTDLNPEIKKVKEKILSTVPINTKKKLKVIDRIGKKMHGENSARYNQIWDNLDFGKSSLDATYQHLMDLEKKEHNKSVIPDTFSVLSDNTKIFNHSCEDMSELETGSIDCIICSPPYLYLKKYGNAEDELGQESEVNDYIDNLLRIFKECHRVLKDTGSCFVNINDCVVGGQYQAVPQRFVIGMIKQGWLFNDELVWIKRNPRYTRGKRSVRSHEPIYFFTKTTTFDYDESWVKALSDPENHISYGTGKFRPKLLSGLDFRDFVLKTNVANTAELKKKCLEDGFHLTHSATFPEEVVEVCASLTTDYLDTILDPFAGTSVTGQWCRDNFRKFVGYELNPEFIMASEVRLRAAYNWNEQKLLQLEESRQEWLRKRKKENDLSN